MRRLARTVVRLLGVPVAAMLLRLLRLSGRRAGVALVYHELAERPGDPDTELVAPHGAGLVEKQLHHVVHSFRVVGAAELPEAVARRRRGEPFPAAVTFDDDLASHVSLALPILRRRGVPATFFLTGATLEGPFSFWWQKLQKAVDSDPHRLADLSSAVAPVAAEVSHPLALHELARRVEQLDPAARRAFDERLGDNPADEEAGLRSEEVRTLVEAGMAIGFHTRRHHYLPLLKDGELAEAFDEGRGELEDVAGRRLVVIAYPHGVADERVAATARKAGFAVGYTGAPQAVQAEDDPLLVGRVSPSNRSAGHLALQLVAALLRR